MGAHIGFAAHQSERDMVLNRTDRDIEPRRNFLLRQALHFAQDEYFGALRRQCGNRAREHTNTFATIDCIIHRGLTAIF